MFLECANNVPKFMFSRNVVKSDNTTVCWGIYGKPNLDWVLQFVWEYPLKCEEFSFSRKPLKHYASNRFLDKFKLFIHFDALKSLSMSIALIALSIPIALIIFSEHPNR